jgi:hypothetical protein
MMVGYRRMILNSMVRVPGVQRLFINRQPYSAHARLLEETGFQLLESQLVPTLPTFGRAGLAKRFSAMTDEDRRTSGAYIIAVPLRA